MEIVDRIPVTLDPREVAARLRFDPEKAGFGSLDELVAFAQGLIHPRAVFEAADIGERGEETVEVAGITFHGPALRKSLDSVRQAFPYIITTGPELECAAGAQTDLLKQYFLEETANLALELAAGWLCGQLEAHYGVTGLASMSPGSLEDWPLTEQTKLFSIFGDTGRLIGVRLTDSFLMIPRKSVSGIFFPADERSTPCRLCGREHCPSRSAAVTPSRRILTKSFSYE